ncbi:MAG TPA: DUF4383 domain-containing protein [Gaiellaceae bacterium]
MRTRSPIQSAAMLAGVVFLLVGILGFIPGITTHYSDLKFAGHNSDAKLLGLFNVSILHNIVHLLFGVAGVALAKTWEGAKTYLLYGGLIYLVLFVYGVIWHSNTSANFVPVNWADNILHLGLGIGMIGLGVVLGKETVRRDRPAPAV